MPTHFFLTVFIWYIGSPCVAENVSQALAERAFYHATQILKRFPPDKYFIVNFGLSTPVISGALRILIGNLKLSDRYFVEMPVRGYIHVSSGPRRDLRDFLNSVLPPPEALGNRELVFVRVLDVGFTMEYFAQDFDKFYRTDSARLSISDRQPSAHAYFITNRPLHQDRIARYKQGLRGQIIIAVEPDEKLLIKPITREWNRGLPNDPSNFTRYVPIDGSNPNNTKLKDNTNWQKLDATLQNLVPNYLQLAQTADPAFSRTAIRQKLMALPEPPLRHLARFLGRNADDLIRTKGCKPELEATATANPP